MNSARQKNVRSSLIAAAASAVVCAVVAVGSLTLRDFLSGYLDALFFFVQMSIGALGILCIHNITGGKWGELIHPFLRWTAPTFLLLTVLFLPFFFFETSIYPWANLNLITHDPLIMKRTMMMNVPFFTSRSLIYLLSWCAFALWVERRALQRATRPLRALSGGTLLLILCTFSLASMDWIMTLDREWSATGFGVLALTGAIGNGTAFAILMTVNAADSRKREALTPALLGDLGNLLLMSVMLWAYIDFTQYLISWSGQLPREIRWYDARTNGVWLTATLVVFATHFVLPFSLLLFKRVKHSPRGMSVLALMVLFSQALENVIWSAPSLGISLPRALLSLVVSLTPLAFLWKAVVDWRGQQDFATDAVGVAV